MSPEAAIHIISQALWTTVLLVRAAAADRLRGGNRREHHSDRDVDAGCRLQHHSAAGCILVRLSAVAALDAEADLGLLDLDFRRLIALCTLAPPSTRRCSTGSCWCWPAWPEFSFFFLCRVSRPARMPPRSRSPLALPSRLYSRWPVVNPAPASMVQLTGWMLAEAGIGLATGLAVAFIIEVVVMAAQAISTQAGFAYASTVDPNTEADATVLILIAQFIAGMLFFAMGLDRQLLSILSRSLETIRRALLPRPVRASRRWSCSGSGIFSTGHPAGASSDDVAVPD